MKFSLYKAILLVVAATSAQAVMADPAPQDSAAVIKARQIRLDVEEKQKALLEEKRVAAPRPAKPAAPLELTIDETDSPGATK